VSWLRGSLRCRRTMAVCVRGLGFGFLERFYQRQASSGVDVRARDVL
jgi:hypothetical protein